MSDLRNLIGKMVHGNVITSCANRGGKYFVGLDHGKAEFPITHEDAISLMQGNYIGVELKSSLLEEVKELPLTKPVHIAINSDITQRKVFKQ